MFLIRFLFRFIYKSILWSLLIGAGVSAYLYFQYKPLIDFAMNPHEYSIETAGSATHYGQTVDARNLSVRKENVDRSVTLQAEAQPAVTGVYAYARGKIAEARSKLGEASAKLSRANPQDPQKQAKVAKARALVPKAYGLLDQADSLVNSLAGLQEKALGRLQSAKSAAGK